MRKLLWGFSIVALFAVALLAPQWSETSIQLPAAQAIRHPRLDNALPRTASLSQDGESRVAFPDAASSIAADPLSILVTTAGGSSVVGATISAVSRNGGRDGQKLGATGSDGTCLLDRQLLRGAEFEDGWILASHAGYQASEVLLGVALSATSVELVLRPAARATVTCRDREGQPIAGVNLTFSPSPIPVAADPADLHFCPLGRSGAGRASSGTDGRAKLDQLPPGQVFVQASHPMYVLVDGASRGPITVSADLDAELNLVFDPILAALATVTNDVVLGYKCSLPSGLSAHPAVVGALNRVHAHWTRSGSGVLCTVGIPKFSRGSYVLDDMHVDFTVFTSAAGKSMFLVPVRRLASVTEPLQLRVVGAVPTANVSFVLRTPSGRRLSELAGFHLVPSSESGALGLGVGLTSRPMMLPRGHYRVHSSQPVFRKANLGSVSVEQDGLLELPVGVECTPCQLAWNYTSGSVVDAGEVSLEAGGQTFFMAVAEGLSGSTWHLPVGRCVVSLVTPMGELRGQAVDVVAGEGISSYFVGVVR